jgi:quercetin dioxygenase-like cupin family protein
MQLTIRDTWPVVVFVCAAAYVAAQTPRERTAQPQRPPENQQAVTTGPGDLKSWFAIPPDHILWSKNNDGSPRENAYLIGQGNKPGLYIQLVRWPPHTTATAHSHPDDRYVVVLSGTLYHGRGDKFDVNKLEKRSTGTFFTEPGGVGHFGATNDEGVVLYFVGTGPSRTDQIEK